ncbi:MAG: response regulator, partial [Chloroflexota bacterium]|nr:response regulator [Chloroflexota bacterium]
IGTDNTARKQAEAALAKAGALQIAISNRAEQLALASKYKSQFLANMSHELRTPLNSLLILARILGDNGDQNLSAKQVEFAKTIHAAGKDLLSLINDILDLSKIESGTISIDVGEVVLKDLRDDVERGFRQMAEQKGLDFSVELEPSLGTAMVTDAKRLQQVLRNLLANSLKFTERGKVSLHIGVARGGWTAGNDVLDAAGTVLSFRVTDTGIGIPAEKQKIIFEAFQQADGTTSRKFGGTGLGLSISREIAGLLGGEIQVESVPGTGSTFTFYLPEVYVALDGAQALPASAAPSISKPLVRNGDEVIVDTAAVKASDAFALRPFKDDRESLEKGDRVLLVIEDDPRFAKIVLDMARERGFKVVIAERGDIGLALANDLQPDAITLDIQLPVLDGWSVLNRLKRNPRTRHIPVNVISVMNRQQRGATMGAFAYLEKPVDRDALDGAFDHLATFLHRKVRRLLLVEDNSLERASLEGILGESEDVEVVCASTAEDALSALDLSQKGFDCMVVDLGLPDVDGFTLIEKLKKQARFQDLPIIAYTAKDLSANEEKRLLRNVETVIAKASFKSSEHLLADTAMFLGRVEARLPDHVKSVLQDERDLLNSVSGKKVLVVDDDIRNIFALTALLEHHEMSVVFAESGRAGIALLESTPDIDLVMMDIMMPEMDGYEAIRVIRQNPQFQNLPIIAVTAQALKEDKEKCLAAGASDYLPKPVEQEKLLELCQLWIRPKSTSAGSRERA